MQQLIQEKMKKITASNELALKGEIVIFGSTYMSGFPLYELVNRSCLENAIYNRSIENLKIEDALELLQVCVIDIAPSKIFLCFGEAELEESKAISAYRQMIDRIGERLPTAQIYVIGLEIDQLRAFNTQVRRLCSEKKAVYISLSGNVASKHPSDVYRTQFKNLLCFFRSGRIDFFDAFATERL